MIKKKIVRAYIERVDGNLIPSPMSGGVTEGMIEITMLGVTEEGKVVRFVPIYSQQHRATVPLLLRRLEACIEGTEQVISEELK